MAFPKKHLYNDEQIILDRYPHWWYLAPRALALLATCAFGIFTLAYDFGDDWRHTVQIEGVEPAQPHTPYPCFIEGAGRCPPEDVGGTLGFEAFLEAVTTTRHPERRTMLEWYGGPYDPKDINRQLIEFRFAQIAPAQPCLQKEALNQPPSLASTNLSTPPRLS